MFKYTVKNSFKKIFKKIFITIESILPNKYIYRITTDGKYRTTTDGSYRIRG